MTAVVQLENGRNLDEAGLRRYVRERLAAYKCPKNVISILDLGRASNGKADYKGITEYARRESGLTNQAQG